jgi:hypothetical protein
MNFIDTRPSQLFPILTVAQIAIVAGVVPRCFAPVDRLTFLFQDHWDITRHRRAGTDDLRRAARSAC